MGNSRTGVSSTAMDAAPPHGSLWFGALSACYVSALNDALGIDYATIP